MAPLTPAFEFEYHESVASLEPQLNASAAVLELLASACLSGDAYEQRILTVRKKRRTISVPSRELDSVQRRINELIFPVDLLMGPQVHGYVARRSTKTNATVHVGAKFLQKFDVMDFFDSITEAQVAQVLVEIGFGSEAAALLARLVTCMGRLPLGARTSPRISNLILGNFDFEMSTLAEDLGLQYTRFADDLSFSSQSAFNIHTEVESALNSYGFLLNSEKSKSFKHGQPMFVTGLAISDDQFPRLRKRLKSHLRMEFYFVEKYGVGEHARRIGRDAGRTASRMMGQFHYARSIEPDFAANLAVLYPNAFRALIPARTDESIDRVQRHRQEFLEEVGSAPSGNLPVYIPTARFGSR